MRKVLILWLAPILVFVIWYGVAANDLGPGAASRAFHDHLMGLYGAVLGVDPSEIPGMAAKALMIDSLLLWSFVAFRRRFEIADWMRSRGGGTRGVAEAARVRRHRLRADSLSSAP